MKAAVVGGGSWGTTFALHLGRLGIETTLWVREPEILEELRSARENRLFLPGFVLPAKVSFSGDVAEAVRTADVVFIAVPSRFCRHVYTKMASSVRATQIVVSLTKGIEEGSLKRMTEIMAEVFPALSRPRIAVLSGPSFAREVAERHPTAVVAASSDRDVARSIQRLVSDLTFRVYTSEDVAGVELAGALKNVIALAAGISDALRFGHNSRAALITRGLAEITRLGLKLGANKETFLGLAGLGDLVLTCTARMSRNYHVGFELGQGKSLSVVLASMKTVAEGITTATSVRRLAEREGVDMPISAEICKVLHENKSPRDSLRYLMSRELKVE
ncbi:MAG: NAD(P)H-dependent glycerol-3-phosphate dehydrogenase [Clostridiales bacterium]|nr:NAD(P)H-dependent glycerol-3-phosphate dehydrogenase [Clostridiales bacterium]